MCSYPVGGSQTLSYKFCKHSNLDIWYDIDRMPTVSAMELLNADLRPRLMGGDSSSVLSACVVTDLCLLEFTLSLSESTEDVALDLLAGLTGSSESLAICDFLFPVEFTSSLSLEFCSNTKFIHNLKLQILQQLFKTYTW